jgi:alkylation response protein AidB-like acyl-CoA dehydrogenase
MTSASATPRSRTDADPTALDVIARAKALAPTVAAAAARIEAERQLPDDLVAALHEARLFRMLLPRSLGGAELPPHLYVQAIQEIAKADASTAWCVAQTAVCSTAAASLDPATAAEIFGDPCAVLAWGPPGRGRAVAVPGGYRVSGRWQFASGSRHATWLGAHCPIVEHDGKPRLDHEGQPVGRTCMFPRAEASITDVWQVMGLRGTGSDTYEVNDLFVPAGRTVTMFGRNPAEKRERGPLYLFTVFHLYGASFAAVALGIARATLDAFVDLAKTKTPTGGRAVLRESAVVQAQVGLAQAQLASARVFLLHALRDIWDEAAATGELGIDRRIQLRMASTHASHQAKQVVDIAYHAAGATAIFESNPFERRFRDMHTVSQQAQSQAQVFEAVGQHFLGLPLHPRLI